MRIRYCIYFYLMFFIALTSNAQSLTITQPFEFTSEGTVLDVYRDQFGKWEKPDLDDTFPYVVIRMKLDGDLRTANIAKQMLGLYLGTQTAVEAIYKDVEGELIFLIPSRTRHVEVTCGEGCTRQTIIDMAHLKSNTIYEGRVHYVPDLESLNVLTQAPRRQFFTFKLYPNEVSLRVMVNGTWQRWPVVEGLATRSLDYGTYQYEVTAEKYSKQTGIITVSDTSFEKEVILRPQYGWLRIEGGEELADAYVYATNMTTSISKPLGKLPVGTKELDSGTYLIEILKEKYKDYSKQVQIVDGDTTKLFPKLQANYSSVTLIIDDGVDIYIDNRYVGTGTWNGTLENEEFSVETRKDGHRSAYTLLRVIPEDLTNTFILNAPIPAFGSMVIEGEPSGSIVYIDNEKMGETPLVVNQVKVGNRKLRVESNGYDAYVSNVLVEENQEKWINYTLAKATDKPIVSETITANEEEKVVTAQEPVMETILEVVDLTNVSLPQVSIIPNMNVMGTTVVLGGNVSNDGGASVTQRGFCYSADTSQPTIEDYKVEVNKGMGWFTTNIMKLHPLKRYYVRAYAINAKGVAYSDAVDFTTTYSLPSCRTYATNDIGVFSAFAGGIIQLDGVEPSTIDSHGICFKTSPEPTIEDYIIEGVAENDTMICELVDLQANTMYYARSYVVYKGKPIYGNEISFKTLNNVKTYTINGVSFNMIKVQGGPSKIISSPLPIRGELQTMQPATVITLPDYYIGETEVTQRLWDAVMDNNPSTVKNWQSPVDNVSWVDCLEFIKKLNELTGLEFQLPTETEWEFAARGGIYSKGYRYAGSNESNKVAWLYDKHISSPSMVKRLAPNELGIYDMTGNVREWCSNVYNREGESLVDAKEVDLNAIAVCRSSSFKLRNEDGIISSYMIRPVIFKGNDLGLRLSLILEDDDLITISPLVVKDVSYHTATIDFNIVANGGSPIVESGICYSKNENPSIADQTVINRAQSFENNSIIMSDLDPSTTYYIRAYAINSVGVVYGEQTSFTTSDIKTVSVNGVSFKMIQVKGHTFMMGADASQGESQAHEFPQHQVTLSDFYIGQTEVTQELWSVVMGTNPSYHTDDLQRPVEMVSWEDCQIFIAKLNELTGLTFRLPTESEWEFAARGGVYTTHNKYAGTKYHVDDVGWYTINSRNTTHPVGQRNANELGLYDMSGNVWEWCSDKYGMYSSEPQINPTGSTQGATYVVRGGCFSLDSKYARVSSRYYHMPTYKSHTFGLRLAL